MCRSKAGIIRLASRTKFSKPELMDLQANFWKHWLNEDSRRVSGMAPLPGEDVLTLAVRGVCVGRCCTLLAGPSATTMP